MLYPKIRPAIILALTFTIAFLSVIVTASCSNSQTLRCTRVIDGDTITLSNGERVRLIGVDIPENQLNTMVRKLRLSLKGWYKVNSSNLSMTGRKRIKMVGC